MRPLPLALSTLAVLLILGCGPSADKPIPVNTEGNGAPAAEPAKEPAADPAATTTDAGGVNADEAKLAGDLAAHDEAFKSALGALAEAAQQDLAMNAEMKTAEAAALEKLGGAMSEEVAEREKQAMIVAGDVINALKAKGFDVTANVITLENTAIPEPAKALVDSLKVGDTSKIFEWNGGYGVIRKMGTTDTGVKIGYIWATKEAAAGPTAGTVAPAAGTTATSPDGTTTETPAGGTTTGTGGH